MQQKADILGIIKGSIGGGPLIGPFLAPGFAWIDALENTEATEIRERDLKEFEGLVAGYVGLCSAFLAFLLDSHCGSVLRRGDGRQKVTDADQNLRKFEVFSAL